MEVPVPKLNAMLICDKVITEKETNKKSLIGIFENIYYVGKAPCTHPSLAIYLKFTEANGSYNFRLELVDLEKNLVIGKGEIPQPINVANRLGTHELVFNLGLLTFEHEGKYEFRVFANDKIFGQKTFFVRPIPPKKGPERGY